MPRNDIFLPLRVSRSTDFSYRLFRDQVLLLYIRNLIATFCVKLKAEKLSNNELWHCEMYTLSFNYSCFKENKTSVTVYSETCLYTVYQINQKKTYCHLLCEVCSISKNITSVCIKKSTHLFCFEEYRTSDTLFSENKCIYYKADLPGLPTTNLIVRSYRTVSSCVMLSA